FCSIGYHAVSNMQRLHLHVISTDFVTTSLLKMKYYWNSFTTPFFLPSSNIRRQLRKTSKIPPEESEGHLTTELKCHRCATRLKNMPQLKKHLLTQVNK
ncbi:PREDICTED: LOW QUALITY PROTEIN: aprataxin, partial [Dinoponera quadriceps]|uniref:LOW QUALITY PROTEIN: aprataxin n=1 Tax=Dinoponera quadriceps TaxID=609295 RepID=A0A6P3WST5_DINQU